MNQSTPCKGVTLPELVVAMAIVAILSIISVPNFTQWYTAMESRRVGNELLGMFHFARNEAIRSGNLVTLCPLNATNQCSTDWNQTITVFRDPGNTKRLTDPSLISRTYDPSNSGRLTIASLTRRSFQFRANGMTFGDLGNLTWCPDSTEARLASHLVISRGGRARQSQNRLSDGTPIKANGDPVRCL